jgi:hypothetical protein
MKSLKHILLFMFVFALVGVSKAQNDSIGNYSSKKPYHVVLKDGSSYTGFISNDDGREILMRTTTIGDVYIRKSDIAKISEIDDTKKFSEGKYMGDEIYYTRYFFSPTAFSLNKGDANAYMPYLLGAHAQFGVTDNLDVGIGSTYVGTPLTATIKYSFKVGRNLTAAIGGMGLTTTYLRFGNYFGVATGYGVLTSGDPSSNISIGGGYGLIAIDTERLMGYFVTAGAYKRLSQYFSIVVDGIYFPEIEFYFAGPGVRYFRRNRPGDIIDVGVMLYGLNNQFNTTRPRGFPYVSYIISL